MNVDQMHGPFLIAEIRHTFFNKISSDSIEKINKITAYVRGIQPVRDQEPHFSFVLLQRATSYTWAHINITPSLPHSHTRLCSARFIVNITHQHDNGITLPATYCYACYLVLLLVIM